MYVKKKLRIKREVSWYESCIMWDRGLLLTKDLKELAYKMFGSRTAYAMCRCIDAIEPPRSYKRSDLKEFYLRNTAVM